MANSTVCRSWGGEINKITETSGGWSDLESSRSGSREQALPRSSQLGSCRPESWPSVATSNFFLGIKQFGFVCETQFPNADNQFSVSVAQIWPASYWVSMFDSRFP